jgi:hypothetical protein
MTIFYQQLVFASMVTKSSSAHTETPRETLKRLIREAEFSEEIANLEYRECLADAKRWRGERTTDEFLAQQIEDGSIPANITRMKAWHEIEVFLRARQHQSATCPYCCKRQTLTVTPKPKTWGMWPPTGLVFANCPDCNSDVSLAYDKNTPRVVATRLSKP